MSERFKELVLKTSDAAMRRGFESHSLRQILSLHSTWSDTQEAEGAPLLREKACKKRARVQISLTPPRKKHLLLQVLFSMEFSISVC